MISPADDPTWPVCATHPDESPHWCDTVRDHLYNGNDGNTLEAGVSVCVPIYPTDDIYAEVSLAATVIANTLVDMALVDSHTASQDLEPLGFYTFGEGRISIAEVLFDWLESQEVGQCKWHRHSLPQESALLFATRNEDTRTLKINKWCIRTMKKCFFCYRSSKSNSNHASGTTIDLNASNFGLDDKSFSGGSNPQALQALKDRLAGKK